MPNQHTYHVLNSTAAAQASTARRRARREATETVSNKLHAALWVIAAGAVCIFTQFPSTVLYDPAISSGWLWLCVVATGIALACGVYLLVYLPYIARISVSWDVYCPNIIPIASISGFIAFIALTIAVWPVYGLLSVPVITIQAVGALMSFHFIPTW